MSSRQLFLAAVIAAATGMAIGTSADDASMMRHAAAGPVTLQIEGDLPSLAGATEWINSAPLTAAGLRGKVVVVEFWTYTCINWLRTMPYVRAWAAKYRDQGLVVIGVHSPEFEFEKDIGNVRRAAKDLRVDYPIAVDSEHAMWQAFRNQYWPALYFVDARGRIRHHQFGEGEYERAERVIQQLLTEAGAPGVGRDLVTAEARGVEVAADRSHLKSAENYVGHERTENFASPGGAVLGQPRGYAAPSRLSLNHWALSGEWAVGGRPLSWGRSTVESRTAFTPAIFISSWGRRPDRSPCDFACSSMDSRRVSRTELTSTPRTTAQRGNSGCIS